MVDGINLTFYLTPVTPITQLLLTICRSEGKRVGFLPTWYKYMLKLNTLLNFLTYDNRSRDDMENSTGFCS